MQVPNSLITISCADGRGYGPLMLPAYYEKIFRRVYTQRLDPTSPGGGILIADYPANGNNDSRYREFFSIAGERAAIRAAYKGDKHGFIDEVFTDAELGAAITDLMIKEAERLTKAARPAEVVIPHQSFIDLGIAPEVCVAIQGAGFVNRTLCVGASIMDLNNIPGVTLDLALKLTSEPKAEPVAKLEAKK
jgi:hypothetical protein